MTFTLRRGAVYIANASASLPAKSEGGRPRGSQPRKAIALPDGDVLTPLFTAFAEATGLIRRRCSVFGTSCRASILAASAMCVIERRVPSSPHPRSRAGGGCADC
jgi:hypothetical protein